jgi:hypothetical protein
MSAIPVRGDDPRRRGGSVSSLLPSTISLLLMRRNSRKHWLTPVSPSMFSVQISIRRCSAIYIAVRSPFPVLPSRLYDGPVILYRASQPLPAQTRDETLDRADTALGWDGPCSSIEVVDVPGNHLTLLNPPQVTTIANHLGARLTAMTRCTQTLS